MIILFENKSIKKSGEYIRIPKSILKSDQDDDIRICTYIYLCRKRALDDTVGFSIDNLVINGGFKPDWHKNKINDKYKQILNEFASTSMFIDYPEFDKYKHNEYMEITLDINKFDILKHFGIIFLDEIDKILNFKTILKGSDINKSISPSKILLVLSFIRIHKNRRSQKQNYYAEKNPEMYYRRFNDLAVDLNIYPKGISHAIKILNYLDIIAYKELPRFKNKYGKWCSRTNIFVDKYEGWEQELKWGEEKLLKELNKKEE